MMRVLITPCDDAKRTERLIENEYRVFLLPRPGAAKRFCRSVVQRLYLMMSYKALFYRQIIQKSLQIKIQ